MLGASEKLKEQALEKLAPGIIQKVKLHGKKMEI